MDATAILLVELPVFTGAILSVISSLILLVRRDNKRRDDLLVKLSTKLEIMSQSAITDSREVRMIESRMTRAETSLATVKEEVAVIASELEHHERWHERNAG